MGSLSVWPSSMSSEDSASPVSDSDSSARADSVVPPADPVTVAVSALVASALASVSASASFRLVTCDSFRLFSGPLYSLSLLSLPLLLPTLFLLAVLTGTFASTYP